MSKKKFLSWFNPKNWFGHHRKPEGGNDNENSPMGNGDSDKSRVEELQNGNTEAASTDAKPAVTEPSPKEEETWTLGKLYSELSYPSDSKLTEEQMALRIREDLKRMSAAMDCLQRISKQYGSGEDDLQIEQKLEDLFGSTSNADSGDEAKKAVYGKIIETLKTKWDDNPVLKELLRKAEDQCNSKTNESIFEKLVQLAPTMLKRDSKSPISGGSVEVDKKLFNEHKQSIMGLLLAELRSDKYNCPCPTLDANHPDKCIGIIASNLQENIEEKVREYLSINDEAIEKNADLFLPWFVGKIDENSALSAEDDRIGERSLEGVVAYIVNAIINAKRYKEKCERLENERKSAVGTTPSPVVDKPQKPVETGSEAHDGQEVENLKMQIDELNRQIKDNREAANREKKDLEKKTNEANKKVLEVVKELQSLIKQDTAEEQAASETSEDKDATPAQLLKTYTSQVESEKKELTDKKDKLERKCSELETEKDALTSEKSAVEASLKEKESVLNGEANALTEALQKGIERVEAVLNAPVATSCNGADDDFVSQADEIDDRLKSALKEWLENLKTVKPEKNVKPEEVRKQIQAALLKTFEAEGGPIGTLCRYFAYSRMPFMTDPDRDESGIMFYRKNVFTLYKAVEDLYVRFGISFDLPPLFAMGIGEGDYECLDGKEEPDINNLCPNCTNHRDNMDTHNKPQSMVYDIAEVGYSVDGKQIKKTGVITF